jgi:hypothetical protein
VRRESEDDSSQVNRLIDGRAAILKASHFCDIEEAAMNEIPTINSSEKSGCTGIILRFFWMMIGNALLLVMALLIAQKKSLFSLYDILFWVVVGLLILARYIDIVYFHGDDADGKPTTIKHWHRYIALLLLVSFAVWSISNGIAYFY